MMFVYIHDPPFFRQYDVTDNAFNVGDSQYRSADTSGGLREFKQIFPLISFLMKAITQHESVVTYIKSCLIFKIPRFMLMSYHFKVPYNIKAVVSSVTGDPYYTFTHTDGPNLVYHKVTLK